MCLWRLFRLNYRLKDLDVMYRDVTAVIDVCDEYLCTNKIVVHVVVVTVCQQQQVCIQTALSV